MRLSKTFSMGSTLILLSAAVLFLQCGEKKTGQQNPAEQLPDGTSFDIAAYGKDLVAQYQCAYCHSPKRNGPEGWIPDPDKLMMGHPGDNPEAIATKVDSLYSAYEFSGKRVYAANISPGREGIGLWSLKQFKSAILEGKSKGDKSGRELLIHPPAFKKIPEQDVAAIFSYLRTLAPQKNVPPQPSL